MADFKESMKILAQLEHENDNSKMLHQNGGENGLTFWGIYQSAHPNLTLWNIIKGYLISHKDIKIASKLLAENKDVMNSVYDFYKKEFWDKMNLDLVISQHKANEIFCFGVNVNWITAVKETQRLLGFNSSNVDGLMGMVTLSKLNNFSEKGFDIEFDKVEIAYYDLIIKRKPYLAKNLKGWKNRAYYV
jgi:lysozyme family protein